MKNSCATRVWFLKAVFSWSYSIPESSFIPYLCCCHHCCPYIQSILPHLPRVVVFSFCNTPTSITSHVTCLILNLSHSSPFTTRTLGCRLSLHLIPLPSSFLPPSTPPQTWSFPFFKVSVTSYTKSVQTSHTVTNIRAPATTILLILHWDSSFWFLHHSGYY